MLMIVFLSSPRKRGCFRRGSLHGQPLSGLPRVSGGVSEITLKELILGGSSPRKRGCFRKEEREQGPMEVFPA